MPPRRVSSFKLLRILLVRFRITGVQMSSKPMISMEMVHPYRSLRPEADLSGPIVESIMSMEWA